jgi:hypothetical protein
VFLLSRHRHRAYVIMVQCAAANAVDAHGQAAGWVGADHAAVGLHPIGGVVESLFGWQEWNGRLERIEAKILPRGREIFPPRKKKQSPTLIVQVQ